MKLLPLLALLLTGCVVDDATARANLSKLSDSDLMTAHANASQSGAVLLVPRARHQMLDEMKRRGLVGQGRDGIPAKEVQP